jgi:hypothetical protein
MPKAKLSFLHYKCFRDLSDIASHDTLLSAEKGKLLYQATLYGVFRE